MERRRKFRILMICLGNICRSPTAEGVLRYVAAREAPELELTIDSAGTADYHIGDPPDPRSQHAAKLRGIDLSGLRARQVRLEDFAHFDLILAMDRNNLRDLEAMRPRGSHAVVQLLMDYTDPAGRDVPDPYYGNADAFERVLDLTTTAARGVIASLQQRA